MYFEQLTAAQMRFLSAIFRESCIKRGYRDRPVDCVRAAGVSDYSGTTLRGVYEGRLGESLGDADWQAIAKVCYQPLTMSGSVILGNTGFNSGDELRALVKRVNGATALI